MGLFIINIASGLLMAALTDYTVNVTKIADDSTTSLQQQWDFKGGEDGAYYICNSYYGSCMTTEDEQPQDRSAIILDRLQVGDLRQKWKIYADDSIRLANDVNFCLDIEGVDLKEGLPVILYKYHNQYNEKFLISSTPAIES